MKQKYVELAKKIMGENINVGVRNELEDELIGIAYQIAQGYDIKPEDFDTLVSDKRAKNGGFSKGYIYSEKVLAIGDIAAENKINVDDKRDVDTKVYKEIEKANEWGIKKIPEKLVRDNIPAMTEAMAKSNWESVCAKDPKMAVSINPLRNYRAKVRVAMPNELKMWLRSKLEEESKEFLAATKKEDVVEDLGDVLEIVETYTARF